MDPQAPMTIEQAIAIINMDVFGTLRKYKIRGYQHNSCRCPIAECVVLMVGYKVMVGSSTVRKADGIVFVGLPENIVEFISEFDSGNHGEFRL